MQCLLKFKSQLITFESAPYNLL